MDLRQTAKPGRSGRKTAGWIGAALCAAAVVALISFPGLPAIAFDASFVSRLLGFEGRAVAPAGSGQVQPRDGRFVVPEADWPTFGLAPVISASFQDQIVTEGRLAIDENSATPVISPHSGRATRIVAVPGGVVRRGQPLLFLEAGEMVQAQNDFIAAMSALDKTQTQLRLAETNARRQQDLFSGRAAPQRDLDQARADLDAARADRRAAGVALEAVERRLKLLGRSDADIQRLRSDHRIDPEFALLSPIDGTVVSRRIGPGQFVTGGGEPLFFVDDLDTLWLNAFVREDDVSRITPGAPIEFRVLAFRDRLFTGKLDFVAPTIDPANRRLLVRATIQNPGRLLKQQMFVSASIQVGDVVTSPSVPRSALVYEGAVTRVWVAYPDRSVEGRRVTVGLIRGETAQIISGLELGELVVVRGTLFVDQMTAAFRR